METQDFTWKPKILLENAGFFRTLGRNDGDGDGCDDCDRNDVAGNDY